MSTYWVNTPNWFKRLYPSKMVWDFCHETTNSVYITFDDGPNPIATPFVLEQLEHYNAKATFFCVGNNVQKYQGIYNSILEQGHSTGNHTFDHLNGWKTESSQYVSNIEKAGKLIGSKLLRPPYGRIKYSQIRKLRKSNKGWKLVMWNLLSADFDNQISPENCLENVLNNIKPGAIVIFHDSQKAWDRMQYALPKVLAYCKEKDWQMKAIPM